MGRPPWAVRARRRAASASPPANEEEDDLPPSPAGSAEVAIELLLRPAATKDESFLKLTTVRVDCFGDGGAAAREELLLTLERMPSKDGEEEEEEATRVLPPLQKQCNAIFCRKSRYASKCIQSQ